MKEYHLEVQQILDYPRCRIYREFVQALISDRNLRASTCSHLFHYTVLCSYANFRTSYLRLDGVSYTIRPGEWVCRISDLMAWFRVRFQHQVLSILSALQELRLISFYKLDCGPFIRYRILAWRTYNTVLDYNCPCQKETGFFFLPISILAKLVGSARASEIDVVLDLWLSTIYQDTNVSGSDLGPVVYFRNGTGSPIISYSELSKRWGRSRSSVGRLLKKLTVLGYLSLVSFPGRYGSVIYLNKYLSVMFQIEDVAICKEAVATRLNIKVEVPDDEVPAAKVSHTSPFCVSDELSSVPKRHIEWIIQKTVEALAHQGFTCFRCKESQIKLYPLSSDCRQTVHVESPTPHALRIELVVECGKHNPPTRFSVLISPLELDPSERRC